MARFRRSRRCMLLAAVAAVGCMSVAHAQAPAQGERQGPGGSGMTDSRIFAPMIDGDRRTNRFRRPVYGNPPAFGAGSTGFDSTNTRRNPRAGPPVVRESAPLPPLAPPDQTVPDVFRERDLPRRPSGATVITPEIPSVYQRERVARRNQPEEGPFDPLGIRMGSFIVKPAVELSGGYDTNPGRLQNEKGSSLWKVAPEIVAKSDWSRHELLFDLRGAFTGYPEQDQYNNPMLDLKAKGRIDITSQTRAELEARYNLLTDSPGDPNIPNDVAESPIYTTFGGTAALAHRFNRLEFTLKGTADKRDYRDAKLNDGSTLDLSDRNYTQYGGSLRGSYEVSPGIKPFVEVGMDRRDHKEQLVECICDNRDSDGQTIRAGAEFELTRRLSGEISAGVVRREYNDPSFPEVTGTLLDAALTYFWSPLTTVKLEMATTVDESILPGVSGALTRDYALQVDHSFRRWLVGTLRFGFGTDDYVGTEREDKRYSVSGLLTYKMTRELWLKGEVRHEWLTSNVGDADWQATAFLLGVRLQR